jgi:hypothetical protein
MDRARVTIICHNYSYLHCRIGLCPVALFILKQIKKNFSEKRRDWARGHIWRSGLRGDLALTISDFC